MAQIVDIYSAKNLLRLIIINKDGQIIFDKHLSRKSLREKLKALRCTYSKESYHIKICKGNKIILNRLFFPLTSDENDILTKVQ